MALGLAYRPDLIDYNFLRLESGECLTDTEKEVFECVLKACKTFTDKSVVARAAGGWVRDKIIGKESDDLDIAVENATGLEFAQVLAAQFDKATTSMAVIEANPEQSKHLETATIHIRSNYWIDVCGLRCDEYASDTRIPIIRPGTPIEDAHRRDFTVNTIFYNINTRKIEDYCDGIQDLKRGYLRTPIDAELSFSDDPLRIMRAFRFASRFGFTLDSSLLLISEQIRSDFEKKISKPRIEIELSKALCGRDPCQAVELVIQTNLFNPVFNSQNIWNLSTEDTIRRVKATAARFTDIMEPQVKIAAILAAIFLPLLHEPNIKDTIGKGRMIPALDFALLRLMKYSTEILSICSKILHLSQMIPDLETNMSRLNLGRFVREGGPNWMYTKLVLYDEKDYRLFVDRIEPQIILEKLDRAYEIKGLFNGKELAQIHGVTPGPGVKQLVDSLIEWQISHPDGTKEEYIAMLSSK